MEIKKSKGADLEKKKHGIFLFSLVIATGFMLMAFEWASYEVAYSLKKGEVGELIEDEVVVQDIIIVRPEPKPQPKTRNPIIDKYEKKPIEEEDSTEVIVLDTTSNIDVTDIIDTVSFAQSDPGPVIEPIHDWVENEPTYQGGLEAMYDELNQHLKPNRIGISGKVFIEFVVEKDGSLSNVIVKRGVHEILDNNALQAVKKLNKWEPGIQNHHPVRVRMVLPINFKVR
jgi:protein TonB